MKLRNLPLEFVVLLYLISYMPNVIITKLVTTRVHPELGRPLTGLETLPASLIVSLVTTYIFIWLFGWHRDAHSTRIAGLRIPIPTRYTLLSGIGTALVLFTVPLSYTFIGVSIPFIQLLMRGDILLIAPIVDLVFGRKVHWWSWTALAMVGIALSLNLIDRGGLNLPTLAIVTVILYTIGYFVRLAVMTKVSKRGDERSVRGYFVEEKVFALPLSIAILAIISASGLGAQSGELEWGFVSVWTDPVIVPLALIGFTLTIISIFAIIILLDARENAYCVPLERAASLIAGIGGSIVLAWGWGLPMPRTAEFLGAAILITAIALLSIAPRFSRPDAQARAESN